MNKILNKLLCPVGLHHIVKSAVDECYTYKYCERCKTLFVDHRWKYIWKLLFGKFDKGMEENTYLNKILKEYGAKK